MRIILYTLLAITFCSCSVTTQVTRVEILKPSSQKLNFNEDDRIMVVANYRNKSKFSTSRTSAIVDDSSQVAETANSFADYYKSIGYFGDSYVPIKYKVIDGKQQDELSKEEIERYSILDRPTYIVEISLFRTLIEQIDRYSYKATYATLWRVYDVSTKQLTKELLLKDSLYYDQYQSVNRDDFNNTVAEDVVGKVVDRMGISLFPHWDQEFRYYLLTVDPDFNKVDMLIKDFKWKEVVNLMTGYLNVEDKNIKYAALFNIALGCEMLGNFDLALKWLEKCQSVKNTDETKIYKVVIENRKSMESEFDENNQ